MTNDLKYTRFALALLGLYSILLGLVLMLLSLLVMGASMVVTTTGDTLIISVALVITGMVTFFGSTQGDDQD